MPNQSIGRSNTLKGRKLVQALLVSVVFFIIQFILIQYHELWADEVHAWEIVRCSHSFSELLQNTRYEGHPQLWFLILYFLQKFTVNYFAMQVVHVVISSGAVFVFCFFSPFNLCKNILFCAGYFFSYEYSIISRNYGIEMLLLFLCAGIYTKYHGKYLGLLSVLFFLLFQTNVFAIIISGPFFAYVIWNIWSNGNRKITHFIVPVIVVIAGFFVAAITTFPPSDTAFGVWYIKPDLHQFTHVLSTGFATYFPLPKFSLHSWNSNILWGLPHYYVIEVILTVVILFFVTVLFKSNRKILLLFYVATIGEWLFIYIKYFGYIRHQGHLYIIFVLCYWLYSAQYPAIQNKLRGIVNRYFVGVILVVQIAGACWANINDVEHPFSNTIAAAKYIHAQGLDKLPMLGDGDFAVAGIAGILDHEIYYIRPAKWGKYILPDQDWGPFIHFKEKDLLAEVNNMLIRKKTDEIVILSYPFDNYKKEGWELLKTFDSSIIKEDYNIYKVRYLPETPEALDSTAEVLINKNQYPGAMKLLEKAIQLKPDYGLAYMNMADCYNNGLQDYNKALANIDSAMKYSPTDDKVVFDKGAILYNSGHKKEGIEMFKQTIKLNPKNVNVYLTLAQCYTATKDYDNALVYLKIGLENNTDNKDIESKIEEYSTAKQSK